MVHTWFWTSCMIHMIKQLDHGLWTGLWTMYGPVVWSIQLSHPYMTTGTTIALTIWAFVNKVIPRTLRRWEDLCHVVPLDWIWDQKRTIDEKLAKFQWSLLIELYHVNVLVLASIPMDIKDVNIREVEWRVYKNCLWNASINLKLFQNKHFFRSTLLIHMLMFEFHYLISTIPGGLPRWLSGKESSYQCRSPGFNPWVRKIPEDGNGNPHQDSCLGNPIDRGT